MKLGAICEEIKRILDGQNDAPDSKFTLREIAIHVNQGLAIAIKENFFENSQADGLMYVDDQFMIDFNSISVTNNSCTIPNTVIGLPRMRGFAVVRNADGTGTEYIPVLLKDIFLHENTKQIKNKVLYYVKGSVMKFIGVVGTAVSMVLLAPSYTDLKTDILISSDIQAKVIQYTVQKLSVSIGRGEDNIKDNVNKIS